jgi:acid phosphatase type 7
VGTTLAVIADFGSCDSGEARVATLVQSWSPAAIATVGDNSQDFEPSCRGYEAAVTPYYGSYIRGAGGPRFWPTLGNHDYDNPGVGIAAYNAYFSYLDATSDSLRRWYSTRVGDITLFVVDTQAPPDALQRQQTWLRAALAESKQAHPADWRLVLMHYGPYSFGFHGSNEAMRPASGWEYAWWGADAVVSGHQHVYERVVVDGMHYFTAGIGNVVASRPCPSQSPGAICLAGAGAVRITAGSSALEVAYVVPTGAGGRVVDSVDIVR